MNEEKQEKPKKPTIGSLSYQYVTIGGRKAASDVQTPERPSSQEAKPLDVQASNSLNSQEVKPFDVQTSNSLNAQEAKLPRWKRRTVYLYPDVDRAVGHHIADTDEEISEVVNAALRQFFGLPGKA